MASARETVGEDYERWVENDLLQSLKVEGIGCIAFSPLAQGLLTNKYLGGIPEGSRGTLKGMDFLREGLTELRVPGELVAVKIAPHKKICVTIGKNRISVPSAKSAPAALAAA